MIFGFGKKKGKKSRKEKVVWSVPALLMCVPNTGADAAARPVSICIAAYGGAEKFVKEANRLGGLDCATVYRELDDKQRLEYSAYPRELDIILVLRIPDERGGANLKKIADGHYDQKLRNLARTVQSDGRDITLRPVPEFNGDWYSYGVYKKGNDPKHFVAAWRRIVAIFRGVENEFTRSGAKAAKVTFDLNVNRRNAKGKIDDFPLLYPGDDVVDMVSISSYNRCGAGPKHVTPRTFASEFGPMYRLIEKTVGPNIPINVAETATMSTCGTEKPRWYGDMFTAIEHQFPRVKGKGAITLFFLTIPPGKASNNVPLYWGPQSDEEWNMFRTMIDGFRVNMEMKKPEPQHGQQIGTSWKPEEVPFTAPVTFWGKLEYVEGDTYVPDASAATGEPFGNIGTLFRFKATQAMMFRVPGEEDVTWGPKVSVGGVMSTNEDRWWDNTLNAGVTLQICKKGSKGSDWSAVCGYVGPDWTQYMSDSTPDRFKDREDKPVVRFGIEFMFGGDWTK